MIQDAKTPIQFGEKLTREFADPTIFLNLQPSLYCLIRPDHLATRIQHVHAVAGTIIIKFNVIICA